MNDKRLKLVEWSEISPTWPEFGHHLLATFDTSTVILYLTCPAEIAQAVLNYKNFRKDLNYLRMGWTLSPSFMTVLHSSQWATRKGQDGVIALVLLRSGFEKLLKEAVNLQYVVMPMVEYQWLYEHDPQGKELERSALELKIRSILVEDLLDEMLLDFFDVSDHVRSLKNASDGFKGTDLKQIKGFRVPGERRYRFMDEGIPPGLNMTKLRVRIGQVNRNKLEGKEAGAVDNNFQNFYNTFI